MIIAINDEILYKIVDYAADIGRMQERIESGKEAEFITQNQAHIRYGRGNVSKWVREGLVRRYKDADGKPKSGVRFNKLELESAAFKCNCFKSISPRAKDEIKDINCII
ncbi:hypothetical protein [uncultured Phocaeicola sp.]|uniref:hypothetical protein n=1 Tax=uncultured Phocaeicola sp. TaxID=990718 RepID=UPI00259A47D3|nr:hypothetical protein [uncultured Phocaeicola sp.]